jgi:hypothetical protein
MRIVILIFSVLQIMGGVGFLTGDIHGRLSLSCLLIAPGIAGCVGAITENGYFIYIAIWANIIAISLLIVGTIFASKWLFGVLAVYNAHYILAGCLSVSYIVIISVGLRYCKSLEQNKGVRSQF